MLVQGVKEIQQAISVISLIKCSGSFILPKPFPAFQEKGEWGLGSYARDTDYRHLLLFLRLSRVRSRH